MSDQLRCTGCGATLYSGPPDCPLCGAPNCCPQCCKISDLQSRLTAAETRIKELESIATKFSSRTLHTSACTRLGTAKQPCSCGLGQLRAELDKLKGKS